MREGEQAMEQTIAIILANKYTGRDRYAVLAYLYDLTIEEAEYLWNRTIQNYLERKKNV